MKDKEEARVSLQQGREARVSCLMAMAGSLSRAHRRPGTSKASQTVCHKDMFKL